MEWIDINNKEQHPTEEGFYVVKTISKYGPTFHKEHVLQTSLHFDKDKKLIWGCNNQLVTHFLK